MSKTSVYPAVILELTEEKNKIAKRQTEIDTLLRLLSGENSGVEVVEKRTRTKRKKSHTPIKGSILKILGKKKLSAKEIFIQFRKENPRKSSYGSIISSLYAMKYKGIVEIDNTKSPATFSITKK